MAAARCSGNGTLHLKRPAKHATPQTSGRASAGSLQVHLLHAFKGSATLNISSGCAPPCSKRACEFGECAIHREAGPALPWCGRCGADRRSDWSGWRTALPCQCIPGALLLCKGTLTDSRCALQDSTCPAATHLHSPLCCESSASHSRQLPLPLEMIAVMPLKVLDGAAAACAMVQTTPQH